MLTRESFKPYGFRESIRYRITCDGCGAKWHICPLEIIEQHKSLICPICGLDACNSPDVKEAYTYYLACDKLYQTGIKDELNFKWFDFKTGRSL